MILKKAEILIHMSRKQRLKREEHGSEILKVIV